MTKSLFASLLGLLFVATTASLDAALPVPESVVWEEGIEYSNPDDEHLSLNLARPKTDSDPLVKTLVSSAQQEQAVSAGQFLDEFLRQALAGRR